MVNGTAAASPPPPRTIAPASSLAPSGNPSVDDDVRSGGIGAGDHLDVPKGTWGGSIEDLTDGVTGAGSDGDATGGDPADVGTVVDDPAGTVNAVVDGTTDTVDGLLGTDVSGVPDAPVQDLTDVAGGLLGS
jgi:hypothetical protein